MKIILASQSPRRKDFLTKMGVKFEIIPSTSEEIIKPNLTFEQIAIDVSKQKATEVFEKTTHLKDRMVIGSDTTVVLGNEIMGKPKNAEDAKRMLQILRGSHHQVYTGLCVIVERNGKVKTYECADKIEVYFKNYSDELIDKYIKTGEPMDKAGAYTIQGIGGALLEKIVGHPASVIGLPIPRLYEIFLNENIEFFNFD